MSTFLSLETSLEEIFVKRAPALPPNSKKALVKYLPWINLALGLITLYSVYVLWHWAHLVNNLVNYANSLNSLYGAPVIAPVNRLSLGVWVSLAILAVEALLYIAAFPATRAQKKSGWDLLFYALIINVVYGIVILFTNYGGLGTLIGALIGSTIGFYLLFQIKALYAAHPTHAAVRQ